MPALRELIEGLEAFFDQGGWVLSVLFVVSLVLWTLILERFWYLRLILPKFVREIEAQWNARHDKVSWYAHQVRDMWIAEAGRRAMANIPFIKSLIALCPLLGLLGTVTGMVEVFDVMALAGNSNPRAMAEGVSKATIPTMAGMVAALSSMYFSIQLGRLAERMKARAEDALSAEGPHA